MASTPRQPHPPETTVPGQEETFICFDLVPARNGDIPFVAMTVHGPENALCVRLNAPAVGDAVRQLMDLRNELRNAR